MSYRHPRLRHTISGYQQQQTRARLFSYAQAKPAPQDNWIVRYSPLIAFLLIVSIGLLCLYGHW